ncbi:MAG: RNA-guided endonuclease IscB [Boseongicola sp.]|nr:RNA-guided endonuclease IscB [Boseongicola sp.]
MLTSARKETIIQSTLNHTLKTDPGMLPQSQALEGSPADMPGQARNGANRSAGGQVVRGESGASRVFVLNRWGDPLMPCHPARTRTLLGKGRAVVVRLHPFTMRLRDRTGGKTQEVGLGIDPGSKRTGIALVRSDGEVLSLAEIEHRGNRVRKLMLRRAACRRRRRSASLRYRKKRFLNRRSGRRLPPSIQSRADNVLSWSARFRLAPVTGIRCETVRFDMQAMDIPGIEGVECRQGTFAGYDAKECLLERWGRKCACCDASGTPLQINHAWPKALGGSRRVSNLTLACASCDQARGSRSVETLLAGRPDRLRRILAEARAPLHDAAAVNAARRVQFEALERTGPPVIGFSGGRTKVNRVRLGIPKPHALDAACVGETSSLSGWDQPVFGIRAMGRRTYARTRVKRFGFPVGCLAARKSEMGFRTGDVVRAAAPAGTRQGVHAGRVAVRASGSFNVQTVSGTVQGISRRHRRIAQRDDGYGYHIDASRKKGTATMHGTRNPAFLPALRCRVSCGSDR